MNVRPALTILAVADLAASVEFYTSAFAWTPSVSTPVYVEFAFADNSGVSLYERAGYASNLGDAAIATAGEGVGPAELYLYADDVELAVAGLQAAGARMLSPLQPRLWGDVAAYFADPDGHVIAVAQPHETE